MSRYADEKTKPQIDEQTYQGSPANQYCPVLGTDEKALRVGQSLIPFYRNGLRKPWGQPGSHVGEQVLICFSDGMHISIPLSRL
jgi:hypothetical protein